MKREKYKCHIRPQCGLLPVPVSSNRLEGRFSPPSGGASRAFGLPQAAAKRLFAGRSPHPLSADRQLRLSSAPQDLRRRKQNKGYPQAP